MNIYTEEDFNDFAVLGKKSFSLSKIAASALSDEDSDEGIEKKEKTQSIDLNGLSFS